MMIMGGIENKFVDALRKALWRVLKDGRTLPWGESLSRTLDFVIAAMGPTILIVEARVGRSLSVADTKYSLPLIEKVWLPVLRKRGLYLIIYGREGFMEPYGRNFFDFVEFPNVNVARIHLNRPRVDMVEQIIRNTFFVINGERTLQPLTARLAQRRISVDRCRDYLSIRHGSSYVEILSEILHQDSTRVDWRNIDGGRDLYGADYKSDEHGSMEWIWKYPDESRDIYDASRDGSMINLNRVVTDGGVGMDYLASKMVCLRI